MQEGTAGNDTDFICGKTHSARDGNGKGGNTFGVALGLGVFQVQRVAQSFQSDVVGALKVRHGAVGLSEAANLLMMPGRHVAQPHEKSDTPGVELEPAEMQVLIDKDRASFNMRARALHEAGMAATAAADAKDAQKLFEVGEQIERACEGCHLSYWYPNEKVPPVPGAPR